MEKQLLFGCVFCGGPTKPTLVERKCVMAKCETCELIHVFRYSEKSWAYEHSEQPKKEVK